VDRAQSPSVHFLPVLASFIPESQFNAIPEPKFVVDGSNMVLHNKLSRADGPSYLAVL
jgi:hypothetical protein